MAFVLSKLAVVLGFADKRSFCFFLYDNNPTSRNSPGTSNIDFPKMFSRVLRGYSIPHGHTSILKSNTFIRKDKLIRVICTLEHVASLSFSI